MKNDLISREALKEDLKQYFSDGTLDSVSAKLAFNMILSKIDNAPTVEIPTELCKGCRFLKDCETCEEKLRPQGEWINHSCYKDVIICSNCNSGDNRWHKDFKFCPNCGADMRKGGADND